MAAMGKVYVGKPLEVKTRKQLLETVKPHHRCYLRADDGDLPEGTTPEAATAGLNVLREGLADHLD